MSREDVFCVYILASSDLAGEQEHIRLENRKVTCSVVAYTPFSGGNHWELPSLRNLLSTDTTLSWEWLLLLRVARTQWFWISGNHTEELSGKKIAFTVFTDPLDDLSSQFRTGFYVLKSQNEDVVLGTTHD